MSAIAASCRLFFFCMAGLLASQAHAGDVLLENINIPGQGATLSIPRVELKNTTLSKEEATRLFTLNTSGPEMLTLLSKFSADQVIIPNMQARVRGGNVTVSQLSALKIESGKVGKLAIGNIELAQTDDKGSPITGRIKTINWENLDLVQMLSPALSSTLPPYRPYIGRFSILESELVLVDKETPKDAVGGNLWRFKLDSIEGNSTTTDDQLYTTQLNMKGFVVDPPPASKDGKELSRVGYDRIEANFSVVGTFNMKEKTLVIDDLSISEVKSGRISMKWALKSIDPILFTGPSSIVRGIAFLNSEFSSLNVRYEDMGLLNRVIREFATKQNQSEEKVRQQFAMIVSQSLPMFLGQDPSIQKFGENLGNFITQPQSISFTLTPRNSPLKLAEFMGVKDPQGFFGLVKLESANGSPLPSK